MNITSSSSVKSDILHTTVISGLVLIAGIATLRFFSVFFTVEEFGWIQLSRRIAAFCFIIMIVGMNISIVREISFEKDEEKKRALASVGILIALTGAIISIVVGLLMDKRISMTAFGQEIKYIGISIGILVASISIYSFEYSLLRATKKIKKANWLLFITSGMAPLIAILISGRFDFDVPQTLILLGLLTLSVGGMPMILRLLSGEVSATLSSLTISEIGVYAFRLISFGIRRVPVPFITGIIFSAGAFVLNHKGLYETAGHLLGVIVIMRLVEQAVAPVTVVMLPHLSSKISSSDQEFLKEYAKSSFEYAFGLGFFITLMCVIIGNDVVIILLGEDYVSSYVSLIIISISSFSLLYNSLLQSMFDSYSKKANVLKCYSVGLIVTISGLCFVDGLVHSSVLVLISLWSISISMIFFSTYLFGNSISPSDIGRVVVSLCVSAPVIYAMRLVLAALGAPGWLLVAGVSLLGFAFYFAVSCVVSAGWTTHARRIVFQTAA